MAFTDDLITGYASGDKLSTGTGWSTTSGENYALEEKADLSGMVFSSGSGTTPTGYQCTDQGSAAKYVQARFTVLAANPNFIISANLVSESTAVGWRLAGTGGTGLRLCKIVSGTITDLTGGTDPRMQGVVGDTYRVEDDGSGNYTLWTDHTGSFVQSGSSQNVSGAEVSTSNTRSGILLNAATSTSSALYDFEAGSLGGGGPTYTLTAAQGSLSLTGEATAFKAARNITASQGSYSLTGESLIFTISRILTASYGGYSLTGEDLLFKISRKLSATYGSYVLTGEDVILTYTPVGGPTYTLTANKGDYSLTGESLGFKTSRNLVAAQGTLTLTGIDARLARGWTLTAAKGDFTITGQTTAFQASRKLLAVYGSFVLTGENANLTYGQLLSGLLITADKIMLITQENKIYSIGAEDRTFSILDENSSDSIH